MYTFLSLSLYIYICTYIHTLPYRNEVLPGSWSRAPIIKIQWDATNSRARARTQSKYVRVDNYIYIYIYVYWTERERETDIHNEIYPIALLPYRLLFIAYWPAA